ncbi:hypothetical protein ABEF95_017038 [Exophiala dermatitidis]
MAASETGKFATLGARVVASFREVLQTFQTGQNEDGDIFFDARFTIQNEFEHFQMFAGEVPLFAVGDRSVDSQLKPSECRVGQLGGLLETYLTQLDSDLQGCVELCRTERSRKVADPKPEESSKGDTHTTDPETFSQSLGEDILDDVVFDDSDEEELTPSGHLGLLMEQIHNIRCSMLGFFTRHWANIHP